MGIREEGPKDAYNIFDQFVPKCFSDNDLSPVLDLKSAYNSRMANPRWGITAEFAENAEGEQNGRIIKRLGFSPRPSACSAVHPRVGVAKPFDGNSASTCPSWTCARP